MTLVKGMPVAAATRLVGEHDTRLWQRFSFERRAKMPWRNTGERLQGKSGLLMATAGAMFTALWVTRR